MKLTELFTSDESDRAVSPVIGVILMVAITVILAAVIGTFVLGLGDQVQETSPNAQWDWDGSASSTVSVTHTGGDTVNPDNVEVTTTGSGGPWCDAGSAWGSGVSDITAGTSCDAMGTTPADGDELRLIWSSEGGGSSSTLSTYEINA